MKVDLYLYRPALDEMPGRGRQAEHGGFDGLFVAESTGDPFQNLAVASQHTSRVTLGTSVALAFPRSPMLSAVSAWELQRPTNGRHILGLGSQVRRHIERRFSAPFTPPAARLREYAQAGRHIWGAFQDEHPLGFHGDYYTLDYLPDAMDPGPRAAGPPTHPIHTQEYLRTVAEPAIARGLAESGRSREEFTLSATVLCIIDEDAGDAGREAVRRQFAFYASTPAYRPVLELHGWGSLGDRLRGLVRRGEHDAMTAQVPDEILDTFCVAARTWDDAIDLAARRYQGLVDRVMFQSAPPPGSLVRSSPPRPSATTAG